MCGQGNASGVVHTVCMTYRLPRALGFSLLVLAATGCPMTHEACEGGTCDSDSGGLDSGSLDGGSLDSGGCAGAAPTCYEGWSGRSDCCIEGSTRPAICAGGWTCEARYFTRAECGRLDPLCEGADAGPPPMLYDDCGRTSDCTLVANTCCGVCGEPSADDLAAINAEQRDPYYTNVSCPESRDGPVPCPDCPSANNPELIATCDMTGFRPACALVDLGAPPYAQCTLDSDCMLATPQCCACGEIPVFNTISVNTATDLNSLVCDPPVVCDPCVAVFSPRAHATCVGGLCDVILDP